MQKKFKICIILLCDIMRKFKAQDRQENAISFEPIFGILSEKYRNFR